MFDNKYIQEELDSFRKKYPKLFRLIIWIVIIALVIMGIITFLVTLKQCSADQESSQHYKKPRFEVVGGKFINPNLPFYLSPLDKNSSREENLMIQLDMDSPVGDLGKYILLQNRPRYEVQLKTNPNIRFDKIEPDDIHYMKAAFPSSDFSENMELIYSFQSPRTQGIAQAKVSGNTVIISLSGKSASFQQHPENTLKFKAQLIEYTLTLTNLDGINVYPSEKILDEKQFTEDVNSTDGYNNYPFKIQLSAEIESATLNNYMLVFIISDKAGNADTAKFRLQNLLARSKPLGVSNLDSLFKPNDYPKNNPTNVQPKTISKSNKETVANSNNTELAKLANYSDRDFMGDLRTIANVSSSRLNDSTIKIFVTPNPNVDSDSITGLTATMVYYGYKNTSGTMFESEEGPQVAFSKHKDNYVTTYLYEIPEVEELRYSGAYAIAVIATIKTGKSRAPSAYFAEVLEIIPIQKEE